MSTIGANKIEAVDPTKQDYQLFRAWGIFSLNPTNTLKGAGLTSFTDRGVGNITVNLSNILERPHGAAKACAGYVDYLSIANPLPAQDCARVSGTSTVEVRCAMSTSASFNDWREGSFGVMA